MKLKRILVLLMALIMATGVMVFAGCRGGGDGDKTVIEVGVQNNSGEVNTINALRQAYMKKNPDVNIKIVRITGNFDNQITKLVNAKNLPDIVQVYDFSAEYWTNKGIFVPISDYMSRDGLKESDYFESVIDITKSGNDDKIYWAARDYNKVVMCINTEMFDIAGIEKPSDDWTWTDFVNVCTTLSAKATEIATAMGQQIFYPVDLNVNWEAFYYPVIKTFGGDLFDKENGTALKNIDAVKEGFNKILTLLDKKLAVPPTQSSAPFPAKQCAISVIARPNVAPYANSLKGADGKATMDFVSMPTFEGTEKSYIGMGCTGYAITNQCEQSKRDACWDFLKFIMTEEGQEVFGATGAGVPTLKALANKSDAQFRQFIPGANHDAFIKFSERDLSMNYMKGFKVNKHIAIRQVLRDELMKNLFFAGDRNSYYNELKVKLENAMR